MALRLRRGPNADRLTITPIEGELLYTIDTKKLYVGDGVTQGGVLVSGIRNILEDLTPQLAADLDLNTHTITGIGNINITGNIHVRGIVEADISGSVFANNSTLLVDGTNGRLVLTENNLQDLGNVNISQLPADGEALVWVSANNAWEPRPVSEAGVVIGSSGANLVEGNSYLIDIQGSIRRDDSTVIVNAETGDATFRNLDVEFDIIADTLTARTIKGDFLTTAGSLIVDGTTGDIQGTSIYSNNYKGQFFSSNDDLMVDHYNNKLLAGTIEATDGIIQNLTTINFTPTAINTEYINASNFVYTPRVNSQFINSADGLFDTLEVLDDVKAARFVATDGFFGDVKAEDSSVIVDTAQSIITAFAVTTQNLISYQGIYTEQVTANTATFNSIQVESITANDSSLLFDGQNAKLILNNNFLNDLGDVAMDGIQDNFVLTWDNAIQKWLPEPVPQYTLPSQITTNLEGNVISSDNTTVILDHTSATLFDPTIQLDTNSSLNIKNNLTLSTLKLFFSPTSQDISGNDPAYYGGIVFARDDINGQLDTGLIYGGNRKIVFSVDPNGITGFQEAKYCTMLIDATDSTMFFGVGTAVPTQHVDVRGNGTFSGFLQVGRYADATARDAAVTSPAEGMIIFNQGTQKFQGYVSDTGLAGGGSSNTTPGWIDLY